MLIVGLTGGVGCGKSTVTDAFARHGVPIIDADEISRELVSPGSEALAKIADRFGSAIILPDGQLDRRVLRSRVFTDAAARLDLEAILHPRVRKKIQERLAQLAAPLRPGYVGVPYCIVAVPLLLEARMTDLVECVLVVDCEPEVQLARVMRRDNCTRSQAESIVAAQLSRELRLAHADEIIDNSADIATLEASVNSLHRQLLERSR